ncbi:MAG: glycosyltransferase family 4 protein [Segetibacter sp.]|nr:glycosyltransferase family 4 protein [Segetibacter sp.]
MRIAVDARFLEANDKPALRDFTKEVFERLSVQHPNHQFIFFVDSRLTHSVDWPLNVTMVTITPKPTNFVSYRWWYDVKLAFALQTQKADVFIAAYGIASLTTSVPQVLIVRDLAFLHKHGVLARNSFSFYKTFFSRFIKKSSAVVTLSHFIKEEIATIAQVEGQNIYTIASGADAVYQPLHSEEREEIKAQVAEGWEYFVFTGILHPASLLNVLKAFSIFKKWQKTNMKLIIAGPFDHAFEKELEKLQSYKYKNEVFVKKELSAKELSKVVAASYALVFPSLYEGFALPVLNAMQCEVPVITTANSSMSEIAEGAGLYVGPGEPGELAEQMKKIFKDEELRNALIAGAKQRAKQFSWDSTAERLWKAIAQTVSR